MNSGAQCNLLSLGSLQRKSGELFQLLNKQETENWFVWSHPTSSDRPEKKTSSCTPPSQALASHLCLHMEVQTDTGFQESFAERLQVDVLHLKFWEGRCLARLTVQHVSLLPVKHFFSAFLCISYFLFSCFRVHSLDGEVSPCGTNVTQCWILISDHISTSLKMCINDYLPKFLWPLPFISAEE